MTGFVLTLSAIISEVHEVGLNAISDKIGTAME